MTIDHGKMSRFLSYVLRHKPESIGLSIDRGGWAKVDELIDCATRHGEDIDRPMLDEVVASNDKQRFRFDDTGSRIRANQGHSFPVDLDLQPIQPPEVLYHGTALRFLKSIMSEGLLPGSRQHVHLSSDYNTALKVGKRYGKPIVLLVRAAAMAKSGVQFFLSENGVWLVDHVAKEYLLEHAESN